jgi:hypothetical protein
VKLKDTMRIIRSLVAGTLLLIQENKGLASSPRIPFNFRSQTLLDPEIFRRGGSIHMS